MKALGATTVLIRLYNSDCRPVILTVLPAGFDSAETCDTLRFERTLGQASETG